MKDIELCAMIRSRGSEHTFPFSILCLLRRSNLGVELSETDLTFLPYQATIQTLPGIAAVHRESTGAFSYDHMFDHNRLRRTWKQRRKERRRASFPERKGPNVVHAHVTPSSSSRLGARCWEFKSPHSDQNGWVIVSQSPIRFFFRTTLHNEYVKAWCVGVSVVFVLVTRENSGMLQDHDSSFLPLRNPSAS